MTTDTAFHRDLVVLGASAGGVEALAAVIAGLPADLPAAVLVVLHIPAHPGSALPAILDRCGPLPVVSAVHGAPLSSGRVHVAVPDHHLLVRDGHILLSQAPKQHRARPAIDALFRSAARWHGLRTVGVVLSGTLDDGAAGLAAIDSVDGACIVQDPRDAMFAGMPQAALSVVPQAQVCPVQAIGARIGALVTQHVQPAADHADRDLIVETDMAENHAGTRYQHQDLPGRPAAISCPDCTGGMNRVRTGAAVHYTCHIGHTWSPQTLLAAQAEKIEQALWTAISMLEEQAGIHDELAQRAAGYPGGLTETHQRAAADEIRKAAGVIRKHFPELVPQV
jgi:two-component system chemotaxis response regulator CheB